MLPSSKKLSEEGYQCLGYNDLAVTLKRCFASDLMRDCLEGYDTLELCAFSLFIHDDNLL